MIRSMTAYTCREMKSNWGSAFWEIRSINQRYLEIYIRLPEECRSLEPMVRKILRMRLTRGKIECDLRFLYDSVTKRPMMLNKNLAKQLLEVANWVKIQSDEGEINPLDILNWPGVLFFPKHDIAIIRTELMDALTFAIDDLIEARESEGYALKIIIEKRLREILIEVSKVKQQIPIILKWQRERLFGKLKEAQIQLENNRLEQEMLLIAQRTDISEELDRLEIHVKATYKILNQNHAIGRRLDFLMQELNRESNTLASKSINAEVTASAIEIKVLIEQMREQIQNIE
ncbi:YicC/YloC family endoribonuclease [Candidatus Profftia sp. (ex Adelges kitamiensis)]|uniref:YicC/YloC family endoribonuclease n=1 Tax=Candidatus Profftia sp. (ex Adelges kitamiensis) TaxID=2864218 RepID=UPI001CE37153|nr:YicC/YloC family endoribonuclease [Candidatus Profftia sp. (ex Adelges kitamiensis)]